MIKIEVTGASIGEVADKLLAIGGSLQANDKLTFNTKDRYAYDWANAEPDENPSDPVMPEVREATKAPKKAKPAPVVEEEPVGEPAAGVVEMVSSESDTATAQPETNASSETAKNTGASSANSGSVEPEQAPGAKALDFDKDIAPLVLKVVAEKGKPVVQDILAQFGVERASQIADDQLGELVAALQDAL